MEIKKEFNAYAYLYTYLAYLIIIAPLILLWGLATEMTPLIEYVFVFSLTFGFELYPRWFANIINIRASPKLTWLNMFIPKYRRFPVVLKIIIPVAMGYIMLLIHNRIDLYKTLAIIAFLVFTLMRVSGMVGLPKIRAPASQQEMTKEQMQEIIEQETDRVRQILQEKVHPDTKLSIVNNPIPSAWVLFLGVPKVTITSSLLLQKSNHIDRVVFHEIGHTKHGIKYGMIKNFLAISSILIGLFLLYYSLLSTGLVVLAYIAFIPVPLFFFRSMIWSRELFAENYAMDQIGVDAWKEVHQESIEYLEKRKMNLNLAKYAVIYPYAVYLVNELK